MENVLVGGANGTTGKKIVTLLESSQYFTPVAMVRKEEQEAQFNNRNIKTVIGDLEQDISHTVKNIDKVIFAAGSGKIQLERKLNKQVEISRDDVAQTLVRVLHDSAEVNETFEIIKGETLIGKVIPN